MGADGGPLTYAVTIRVTVHDPAALAAHAAGLAHAQMLGSDEWAEMRGAEDAGPAAADLIMALDPGAAPPGCTIEACTAREENEP